MCRLFVDKHLKPGTEKILSTTLPENILSQKVLKKLGFAFVSEVQDDGLTYFRFEKKVK